MVDAARTYGYRLRELKDEHDANNPSGLEYFNRVAGLVRRARHATIAAMRSDLGLVAVPLSDRYNGFIRTTFEDEFRAAEQRRLAKSPASGSPESLAASEDAGEENQGPVY